MSRPLVLAVALALGACAGAPRPQHVAVVPPVPSSWPVGDAYLAQSEAALPLVSYRQVFTDARLQALVEQALANNRDLRVAAANIAEARARVRLARSAELPEVGAGASADVSSRNGASRFTLDGGVSGFELDLFHRLANATAAERERALATEAAARTVRLSLVADLADAWAAYGADRELLAIARNTVVNAGRSVQLTRARLEGGIAPRTDLRQAEQVLASAQGDVALRTTALAQDANLVALLVGAPIGEALLPANLAEVAGGVAALPAGTSSEVLLRRPDVIEAEYRLRAAAADIAAARSELFPRIDLTGLLGLASSALGSLLSGEAFSASAGAGISYAIFDAGGRRAQVAVTQTQRDAALAGYERTIQAAFREVADALAVQGRIGERLRAASADTAAATDTAQLTEARYRGGVESFLASLDAQRSLYAAQQAEIAVRLDLARNRIALYRALGGDQATPRPA